MRTPPKLCIFLSAGIVFFACMLCAQEPAMVKVRFRTIGGNCDISGLNYFQEKADKAVSVQQDTRSLFYDYKGGETVLFYRIKPGADGTPLRVPAGEANLKMGGTWPLLIFFQDPRNPEQVRIQVTPDDLTNFPAGSYKFMNYSGQAVKANVGSDSLSLISQQTGLLKGRIDPQKRTNFTQIRSDASGNSKLLYSNNWAINPTLRTMVFINQRTEPGSPITVKRLTDCIELSPEPPK